MSALAATRDLVCRYAIEAAGARDLADGDVAIGCVGHVFAFADERGLVAVGLAIPGAPHTVLVERVCRDTL